MKLTGESKLFLGIFAVTIAIIGLAAWAFTRPARIVTIPKETLIPQTAHTKGKNGATVYLVEFSDFQCPACAAFAPTVQTLTETYKDRLLFAYRHYPLPKHPFAKTAAYAAEAAALQGKFWEAEKVLFENQNTFSDEFFKSKFTKLLELNESKYAKDMTEGIVKQTVDRDAAAAQLLNLPGTPSFFLNGVLLTNLYGPEDLVKAVETAVNK